MDDLTFNLEDMNIKQESADFIADQNTTAEDGSAATIDTDNNDNNSGASINISETLEATDNNNNDNEVEDTLELETDADAEQSSQEDAPSSDTDSSQNSTLNALAQYLKEEGVLFHDDDLKEVKDLAGLKDLIKASNEKAKYANLNDSQKRYQEALESGVPINEFEKIEKEIQTFANIRPDNIAQDANLRYELLAIDMMNQGINRDKALKLAKLSVTDESSVQDATDALANIMKAKKEKFTALTNSSKESRDLKIEDVKKSIFDRQSLLDNKLNDMTKNKLFDMITTSVDSDENGRSLNELQKWQRDNPVESSVLLNYLFMMTNKGQDMKLIQGASTSAASKELERKLQSMSFSDGALNIPDQFMAQQSTPSNNNKQKQHPTINI